MDGRIWDDGNEATSDRSFSSQARFGGIIPAVFTPFHEDGSLNTPQVGRVVERLVKDGVDGLYVCGSTGEGPLLTTEERRRVAEAYVEAAKGRIPVIVQVGHNSLAEARGLAAHAESIGADAIAAYPPSYFKCTSLDVLVDCLHEIMDAAPSLPFIYYHIPAFTGADLDMMQLLGESSKRLPNLVGIKFTSTAVYELQACAEDERFTMLFGCDEMLLSGLCAGAAGAIGSSFNFAAPLYQRIIRAFQERDVEEARRLQSLSISMIRTMYRYRGQPAFKATMKLLGLDCGPNRLPLKTLSSGERHALEEDLRGIGFFDWAR